MLDNRMFTPEFKTKIIIELLQEGDIKKVVENYGISEKQIKDWKTRFLNKLPEIFNDDTPSSEYDKLSKDHEWMRWL